MTAGSSSDDQEECRIQYRSRFSDAGGSTDSAETVCEAIQDGAFAKWYRERQVAQNILNGNPYFNGPGEVRNPKRHSPGSLLQCQRKTSYSELNSPEETENPDGIYWFGSRFEEDIVLPFLQDAVTGTEEYITNSMWVDFTAETDAGDLRIKGATDPVIVSRSYEPLLLFEIKTKRSVKNRSKPDRRHRAQVHAYMKGLSENYDRNVSEAIILYGGRTNFDIRTFQVEFDPWFWREVVLSWAKVQTEYRLDDELPPADPEQDWECDYCSYRERCGKGDREFIDTGPTGLLPRYGGYPRVKLIEYLDAHDAALTPTLAYKYPELVEEYNVLDWTCDRCDTAYLWDTIEWDGDVTSPPRCPKCADLETTSLLSAPSPSDQPIEGNNAE